MTTLYAWNTARAGFVAYPNVHEARLFHPTRGRQFFGLCSIYLSPNKKIRPFRTSAFPFPMARFGALSLRRRFDAVFLRHVLKPFPGGNCRNGVC
ncbi:MAG: hypothetical protein BECKG1743D_GA0114223_100417 [Candidatus Kentron sp. G]|nr:MAG: hypothetical protein BECKG1743F_GA0114225_100416 [Candidatus Kentron sp. G]VFM96121.1 MAG: hypothetical protein BECKG1743E_GA0114224_100376 [Candidatus Kentron sp. G]VFM98012.1 MAG: hypothetical protein BECKG1743D_GA0114223_100417 [Candidatus Kentron sp. G]